MAHWPHDARNEHQWSAQRILGESVSCSAFQRERCTPHDSSVRRFVNNRELDAAEHPVDEIDGLGVRCANLTHGFAILDQRCGYFPHVVSLLMDQETLRARLLHRRR
ncbi:MAG: hypothetical protein IBJ03_18325 [Gemmatimonadaceae bacterium]|nr:hypothetical protein [Gemmatimonadaceae bacterium]